MGYALLQLPAPTTNLLSISKQPSCNGSGSLGVKVEVGLGFFLGRDTCMLRDAGLGGRSRPQPSRLVSEFEKDCIGLVPQLVPFWTRLRSLLAQKRIRRMPSASEAKSEREHTKHGFGRSWGLNSATFRQLRQVGKLAGWPRGPLFVS